jgi:hypothetical protein
MESQKTLVTKVVGLGNMHISTKNGMKIQKFAMELAQTMVTWLESQVNSCLVPFFEEFLCTPSSNLNLDEFSSKIIGSSIFVPSGP